MNYAEIPVPIHFYIILATLLFCIGLYGCLSRRNAIAILMSPRAYVQFGEYSSRGLLREARGDIHYFRLSTERRI